MNRKTIITLVVLVIAIGAAIWTIRATGHGCTSCYIQEATSTPAE